MWQYLLNLLRETRRPLVFVDFETSGLGGAPPVEFALLVYAPWEQPQDDDLTRACARVCPPGLSYACERRVNPRRPIDAGAERVHRIADADVKDCIPYDDLEIRAFFQGWNAGDSTDSVGPAIWCGHNAAGADVPWARSWGYLPGADLEVDIVDTMRIVRRLQKAAAYPLAHDCLTDLDQAKRTAIINVEGVEAIAHGLAAFGVPATSMGLDAFASSLVGAHAALLGGRPAKEHGALADCCSTARVLCRLLDLWSPMWPPGRADLPASANLGSLLAAFDAPPPGQVSWDGWLAEYDGTPVAGAPAYVWAKGKHRGKAAGCDPGYRQWVCGLPRAPDASGDAWCSQHTADILRSQPAAAVVR